MLNLPQLQTECLSDEVLKSYLAGYLPEDSATQVEQHLSQCTECEHLMQEIDAQGSCDELLRPIQMASPPNHPSEVSAEVQDANSQESRVASPRPWLPWMNSREIGPYELLEPLGHGGMGLVYLARHRKLDRLVAIKLLPAHHQTAEARVRFEREILAAGRLQHPSIVDATDAGQFGDMDYLVMEYVRGLDLGRLSKSIPVLNFEETCEIGRQIALGLSYAHSQGFVHRDIKPSNVILDDTGVVKILDFGLVLFDRWDGVSNELTTVGQFLGTLDYMAPEQAERCGSVDFRADLYALGATLFKLLCGRAPLAAAPNQSPIDKLRLLATHRPPSLRTLRPDAPEPLIQLVDGLLSTATQSRPASAAHVAEDLQPMANPGCLVDLIARARSVEADAKTSDALPAEKRMQTRSVYAPSIPVQPNSVRRGNGNRWLVWAAAAMVPLAFLAGYIIQLDTPEGQFIVESEVAGAQLKIVKAGAESKNLKIETGNSVTKLSAGKYELTLDSPSDGVSIDRDSFVIERGKVVIARIRKVPAYMLEGNMLPPPGTSAISTIPKATDATYDGKTLAEWLEVARREKEQKSWLVAMSAVNALTDAGQKQELFEEVFQLCLSQGDLNVSRSWGLSALANRIVHELENVVPDRRQRIAKLAGGCLSEKSLDPIWKWLESNLERNPQESKALAKGIMGLPETESRNMWSSRFHNIVYLAKYFPRLSTLFDDFLLRHWDSARASSPGEADPLFLHVQGIALNRLESFDTGFAESIAALAIILERDNNKNGSFLELSVAQKELVCRRTVELICEASNNRETPFVADWTTTPAFLRLSWPSRTLENSDRKALSVPRLFSILHYFFQRVQPDVATHSKILSALAVLEEESRVDATSAIADLTRDLSDITLSGAHFSHQDFRLDDKISVGQKVVYPLPSTLSAERRAEIDDGCFAYNVHRYVSFLLWDLSTLHERLSPTEIGTRLSAFLMLDLNQDWWLSQDEWLPGFETRLGTGSQKIRISEFSKTLTLEELAKLHQSKGSFSQFDSDKDNRMSTEEATGIDDFSGADRNSDGFLNFAEYSLRGTPIIQAKQPTPVDPRFREWAAGRLNRLDKDNNGFLSIEELNDDDKFAKADLNRDGRIDIDEYVNSRR